MTGNLQLILEFMTKTFNVNSCSPELIKVQHVYVIVVTGLLVEKCDVMEHLCSTFLVLSSSPLVAEPFGITYQVAGL